MEYRKMGNTGLNLSVLSFGSWVTFAKQIDDFKADRLMSIAYERGINFFDNAEVYSQGESERMMGRILIHKKWERSSYVLSSKVFFGKKGKDSLPNERGLGRKHIMEACYEALERMHTEYLDLYYCHRPDPDVPMEEIVRTMNTLINQGVIFYWGTSEWSGQEIMEANKIAKELGLEGPKVEQPQYNMLERYKVEKEFNQVYDTYGLGTTIWSPLASGLLTGKYDEGIPDDSRLSMEGFEWLKDKTLTDENMKKVANLRPIAEQLGVSMAVLAIAWTIKNPRVTSAILGATSDVQLLENLSALDIYHHIGEDVMNRIDSVLLNKPA